MRRIFSLLIFIVSALPALAQSPLIARLDSLTAAYANNGYHGVILVAKGGEVLYQKGYGYASLEKRTPHTPATLFKTESVGKMFTAVSIMQLVEKGRLRLDQTVKELLPESRLKNADKITVHHLLTHTSGLKSPWDSPQWKFKKTYSTQEMQSLVEELPLAFDTPGKEMFYSNSGYVVLGWIIEKVSGLPFDNYFQKNIFSPLGMTATRHLMDTAMPEKTGAQPYKLISSKKFIPMTETVGPMSSAAGGWISTAGDLHRFMNGLYQHKLIKPQTWDIMKTANGNQPKDSSFRYYAYGLETYVNQLIPGADVYGHNGGGAGFSIDAFLDPGTGYIVTSCTNIYQNSRNIAANYMKAVLEKPVTAVNKMAGVQLYDLIEEKGIDTVLARSDVYFKDLRIRSTSDFFAQMSDAFLAVHDYANWTKWIDHGIALFPKSARLLVLKGDGLLEMKDKQAAAASYQAAKTIALAEKNEWLISILDEKIKSL